MINVSNFSNTCLSRYIHSQIIILPIHIVDGCMQCYQAMIVS